jgi:hypothetical protein
MNTVKLIISDTLTSLTGSGEEWLVDKNGNIIAIFIDGNFKPAYYLNITVTDTVTAA